MIHFFGADVTYVLFSVLVHSGGVHGGHYYAFIRPTLSDQWCVFISWILVFYGTVCFIYAVNCYFDCGPTLSLRTYNCDYLVLKMPRVLVTLE